MCYQADGLTKVEFSIGNLLPQFQQVGSDLFYRGLVSSHSGNISIRAGSQLIITRRGSMLGHLNEQDLVNIGIEGRVELEELASTELAIHRSIYKHTPTLAIVHAHPPHATALSFLTDCIVPADLEGSFILSKVPVLGQNLKPMSSDIAEEIALLLSSHKAVLVFGHGSFAAGESLEEAYHWTSTLEASCEIMYLKKSYEV